MQELQPESSPLLPDSMRLKNNQSLLVQPHVLHIAHHVSMYKETLALEFMAGCLSLLVALELHHHHQEDDHKLETSFRSWISVQQLAVGSTEAHSLQIVEFSREVGITT